MGSQGIFLLCNSVGRFEIIFPSLQASQRLEMYAESLARACKLDFKPEIVQWGSSSVVFIGISCLHPYWLLIQLRALSLWYPKTVFYMSSNYCVYMCITRKMCIDKFPSRKFNCLFWKVVFVQQFSCIYQLETDKTSNKFFFDMQNNAKQGLRCLSAFSIRIWDLFPCLFRADVCLIRYS